MPIFLFVRFLFVYLYCNQKQITMNSKKSRLKQLKKLYTTSKAAKVGEECVCPSCRSTFTKTNYQQAFCKNHNGTRCKDFYWNNVTPEKRNNVSRISPANAAWQQRMIDREFDNIELYMNDADWGWYEND